MAEKKSFLMYTDYYEQIKMLTLEQRGALLTAIMAYQVGEDLPEMDAMTKMAFSFISADMRRDNEKYEEIVERRRESGRKGGYQKAANQRESNLANVASASFAKTNLANVADNVNVKSNISGYEIKLDIEDAVMIEVIENEDKYNIVILTSENEATIYYYEVLKTDMVNENSFMKSLDNSYTKFELPSLASVGYLTMDGKDTKYVIAESENNDRFIIMNNQLFVFKEQ